MNRHEYSAGAWKYPAPKRQHSKLATAAWVVLWLCAFALSAHWTVKAVNIYMHDSSQVERFAD